MNTKTNSKYFDLSSLDLGELISLQAQTQANKIAESMTEKYKDDFEHWKYLFRRACVDVWDHKDYERMVKNTSKGIPPTRGDKWILSKPSETVHSSVGLSTFTLKYNNRANWDLEIYEHPLRLNHHVFNRYRERTGKHFDPSICKDIPYIPKLKSLNDSTIATGQTLPIEGGILIGAIRYSSLERTKMKYRRRKIYPKINEFNVNHYEETFHAITFVPYSKLTTFQWKIVKAYNDKNYELFEEMDSNNKYLNYKDFAKEEIKW